MIKTKKTKTRLWLVLTVFATLAISALVLSITFTPRQEQQPLTSESVLVLGVWDQVETGSSVEPEVVIYDGDYRLRRNIDYTLAYANNTEPGEATITVTGIGKYSGTQTMKFRILSNEEIPTFFSIEELEITPIPAQTYTGSALTPSVVIMDGEEPLAAENYHVNYYANIKAGLAQAVIYGTGDYTGMRIVSFEIAPKELDDTTVAAVAAQTYSGYSITPAVTITDGERTLAAADYTVAYSNNINAGNASVVITGSGNYTGTKTVPFEITAKELDQDMLVEFEPVIYTTQGHYFDDAILWNEGRRLVAGVDYEFDDTAWYLDAGNYIVVIPGKGNYTGEVYATISILPKNIGFAEVVIEPQVYTGSAIEPEVEGWDDETELVSGTDFTLAFENNIEVGTATLYISGAGNYTGGITVPFSIVQRNIEPAYIAPIDAQTYTGSAIEPALTVTLAGRTLTTADYTASYSNNTNLGLATVTLTGQGNYTGTVSTVFEIVEEEDEVEALPFTIDNWNDGKGYRITNYTGSDAEILIPATFSISSTGEYIAGEDYAISEVGFPWGAGIPFDYTITSIIISEGIERLQQNAFEHYKALETVVLPESITNIPFMAFARLQNLVSVTMSSNIKTIEECAFWLCPLSESIIDLHEVESIGQGVFSDITPSATILLRSDEMVLLENPYLRYREDGSYEGGSPGTFRNNGDNIGGFPNLPVYVPATLLADYRTAYPYYNFQAIEDESEPEDPEPEHTLLPFTFADGILTGYTGSANVVYVPASYALDSEGRAIAYDYETMCENFEELPIYSIAESAFSGNTTITKVVLENYYYDGITLAGGAFKNCTSLVSVDGCIQIYGTNTFENCTSLLYVQFPYESNGYSIPAYTFKGCTSLTSMGGWELTSIGAGAFEGCTNFKTISSGYQLYSIGDRAFAGTQVTSILLEGEGMCTLGEDIFGETQGIIYLNYMGAYYIEDYQTAYPDYTFIAQE